MKKILSILVLISIFLTLIPSNIFAVTSDFVISSDTNISYTTGNDYVSVVTKYTRTVNNRSYYYPATGEKVFNIPDLPDSTEEEIAQERAYKLESLSVTNSTGGSITYTIEEKESGEGIYIKVPNYKQTTSSSPYTINVNYQTHDYIKKVVNHITLQAPALPTDVTFEETDTSTGTTTEYMYGLGITVDENISPLAKAFPSKFTTSTNDTKTTYTFAQEDRIDSSPYLEFGNTVTYQFALTYTTPKTDTFLPEKYSSYFKALSTNIFEISLPREFDETNQKVYFTNVSPTPTDIYQDSEGNYIASFEVPANTIGDITIEGYITVNQDTYSTDIVDMGWEEYKGKISETAYLSSYLKPTTYWQSTDSFIAQEASSLMDGKSTVMEIIRADYAYVGAKLTYDYNKANSENERIGAKAALEGGASVCMEYSDSMIALLRAQGIPARAALGYANITETEESQVRHQWVQAWIPDYGWLTIDPTLESSNMRIGQTVDRVLWEVFNGDNLSNIRVFSADNIDVLTTEGYNLSILGVDASGIDFDALDTYISLIPEKGYDSTEDIPKGSAYNIGQWFNTFLKTTTIGKTLLITGPVLLLVFLISVVVIVTKNISNKIRMRKKIVEVN